MRELCVVRSSPIQTDALGGVMWGLLTIQMQVVEKEKLPDCLQGLSLTTIAVWGQESCPRITALEAQTSVLASFPKAKAPSIIDQVAQQLS